MATCTRVLIDYLMLSNSVDHDQLVKTVPSSIHSQEKISQKTWICLHSHSYLLNRFCSDEITFRVNSTFRQDDYVQPLTKFTLLSMQPISTFGKFFTVSVTVLLHNQWKV